MKTFIAIFAAGTLAAASPLAAAIACGGACWGSANAPNCPGVQSCTPTITGGGSMSLIQSAINAAATGAVICVGPGTYTGNLNFNGHAVTVRAPSGATLASGTAGTPVVTFDSNEGSGSVLDGFTVTGGTAANGAGILITNASPTIQNCLIEGNTATASGSNPNPRGGGVYVGGDEASPSILCSCLENNSSGYAGGGLTSAYLARPYLDNDTFAGNTASYGAGYESVFSGGANIENSEFIGNMASGDGGAMHVLAQFGESFVRRSVFSANTASGNGGAAWVPAGFATILNSIFENNSASNGGAAAVDFDGVLTVESSIVVGNTAATSDAALVQDAGTPGTTLLENYNYFFSNTPADTLNTTGMIGDVTSSSTPPSVYPFVLPMTSTNCYVVISATPPRHSGLPSSFFDNGNGTTNNQGIGGPTTP